MKTLPCALRDVRDISLPWGARAKVPNPQHIAGLKKGDVVRVCVDTMGDRADLIFPDVRILEVPLLGFVGEVLDASEVEARFLESGTRIVFTSRDIVEIMGG